MELKKSLTIVAITAFLASPISGQFNEVDFVGLAPTSPSFPNQTYNAAVNSLRYIGVSFGSLPEQSLTTWANGLSCTGTTSSSGADCFRNAIGNSLQIGVSGVASTGAPNTTYADPAAMVMMSSYNISQYYVGENRGQGINNATTTALAQQICIPGQINTSNQIANISTLQSINTNGYVIKTTCKASCSPGQVPYADLQALGASIANSLMTSNNWAARFVVLANPVNGWGSGFTSSPPQNNAGLAVARCRVTITAGDGYAISQCPDYIPKWGCKNNGDQLFTEGPPFTSP